MNVVLITHALPLNLSQRSGALPAGQERFGIDRAMFDLDAETRRGRRICEVDQACCFDGAMLKNQVRERSFTFGRRVSSPVLKLDRPAIPLRRLYLSLA